MAIEVSGHKIIFRVGEDPFEGPVGCLLDSLLDLIVTGPCLETTGEIHNGNILGWDTHGHPGELSIELWNNFTDSLQKKDLAYNLC